MKKAISKHIVIDARIRRASTGRPVDRLLEYVQKLDTTNRYTILLQPDDPWKPSSRKFKTVVCKYPTFSFNPLQQLTYAWQLYKLKPDLVHFTMTGQQPIFYFGKQITFTHDLTMFKYVRAGRLPKWLHKLRMYGYRLILWQAHKKARIIHVPSEYVRDAVAKFHLFTNRKLIVTLEATEPPLSVDEQKPNYDLDEYIMYVGSSFAHKNLERLVDAFGLLLEQHPALKLVLVGKKEYHAKQLKKYISRKPYSESVIQTGFVPDKELKWLYTHARAYTFASLSEGFGLPPLEAMAHGCPVASSNASCMPEILGDAAHYFDPYNIEDIVTKIDDVITNTRLRNKLIENGRQQVKKYSWKRMSEQTLAIYNQVLRV